MYGTREFIGGIKGGLRRCNIAVMRQTNFERLSKRNQLTEFVNYEHFLKFLDATKAENVQRVLAERTRFSSQIMQDLFVLDQTDFKRDGYFVEFGATDGKRLSNTFLLEAEYGWTGILAEPARRWHDGLIRNRRCHISTDCVWSETGTTIPFKETRLLELSTISRFAASDQHGPLREDASEYDVKTVSLNDLLARFEAPRRIDYLSLDTEGSEYDILKAFDFDRYEIGIITCEHNHSLNRDKILSLLQEVGYERCVPHLSDFDDWFVLKR